MSRNNVFKVSGNMALGGQNYQVNSNSEFDNIKNSLKLLKSKQNQKRNDIPNELNNVYSGSYSSNAAQRQPSNSKNIAAQDYNYQPNSLPQKDIYRPIQQHDYQHQQSKQQIPPKKPIQHHQQYDQYAVNQGSKPHRQLQRNPTQEYDQYPINQPTKPQKQMQPPRRNPPMQQYDQYALNEGTKPQRSKKMSQYQEPPRQEYRQAPQQDYRKPPQQNSRKPPQQEYRPSNEKGSGFEDRNIKELNRQNRVQIQEYDPSDLVLCSEGCGRKFNPDSIGKHQGVCRKVFQQKRKEFNAQDQRVVQKQQKKLMKRGELIQQKIEEKKAQEKVPKWKAQSLQLRAGLKMARNDNYAPTKEQQKIMDQVKQSSTVKCQFCGRSFNEQAGAKHIIFCQAQQKKTQMRRK